MAGSSPPLAGLQGEGRSPGIPDDALLHTGYRPSCYGCYGLSSSIRTVGVVTVAIGILASGLFARRIVVGPGLPDIQQLACAAWSSSAQADKRVALVIGNSEYGPQARLSNPVNDAGQRAALRDRVGRYCDAKLLDHVRECVRWGVRKTGRRISFSLRRHPIDGMFCFRRPSKPYPTRFEFVGYGCYTLHEPKT
jgi:hypothetical protein